MPAEGGRIEIRKLVDASRDSMPVAGRQTFRRVWLSVVLKPLAKRESRNVDTDGILLYGTAAVGDGCGREGGSVGLNLGR